MKKIALLVCLSAVIPGASFGQYFTDMFTSATLDATKWRVIPAFSDSSVVQSGGAVTLANRGNLITVSNQPAAIDITVKFQFTGSQYDGFSVVTRTDGAVTNGSRTFDRGIGFNVQMRSDTGSNANNVWITHNDYPNPGPDLIRGTYPVALNQSYTMRVVDDGTNVFLYLNDLTTPLLRASDTLRRGNLIGFTNREGAAAGSSISAGSQVKISAFTVNTTTVVTNTVTNTVTVPDTSGRLVNLSTLTNGGTTMGFVVAGTTSKRMLIRAVGPTLQSFGVTSPASQTSLTVYSGSTVVGSNGGWSSSPSAAQISAVAGPFPLIVGSADSAVLTTLQPGNYTAQATANGAVLLEVYEAP